MLCLREVNVHVCAALRNWAGAARLAPLLPRQPVPSMTVLPATDCCAGATCLARLGLASVLTRTRCRALTSRFPVCCCSLPKNFRMSGARHQLLWHERRQRTHAALRLRPWASCHCWHACLGLETQPRLARPLPAPPRHSCGFWMQRRRRQVRRLLLRSSSLEGCVCSTAVS